MSKPKPDKEDDPTKRDREERKDPEPPAKKEIKDPLPKDPRDQPGEYRV